MLHESLGTIEKGHNDYMDLLIRLDRLTLEWDDKRCEALYHAMRDWAESARGRRTSEYTAEY